MEHSGLQLNMTKFLIEGPFYSKKYKLINLSFASSLQIKSGQLKSVITGKFIHET